MVGFSLLFRDTTKSHYVCHGLHAMHLLQEEREERSKTSSLIISKLMQEVDVLVSASVCSPRIWLKCTFVQRAEFLALVHTGDRADSDSQTAQAPNVEEPHPAMWSWGWGWGGQSEAWVIGTEAVVTK